jgi:hypothetical protein
LGDATFALALKSAWDGFAAKLCAVNAFGYFGHSASGNIGQGAPALAALAAAMALEATYNLQLTEPFRAS